MATGQTTDSGSDRIWPCAARLRNFCCFHDSGLFRIENGTTVLIAENENGKSTVLRALEWFSTADPIDPDDVCDLDVADGSPVTEVELHFWMPPDLENQLTARSFDAPVKVAVVKRADGSFIVRDVETGDDLDEASRSAAFSAAYSRILEAAESAEQAEELANIGDYDELLKKSGDPETALRGALESLETWMAQFAPPPATVQSALDEATALLDAALPTAVELVMARIPRFVMFDRRLANIPDTVNLEELANDPTASDHKTFQLIAELAGADRPLWEIAQLDGNRVRKMEQQFRETISKGYNRFWEQDDITIHLRVTETTATLGVDHKGRDQPPSRKSRGLQWFIRFYAHFVGLTNKELRDTVLLIDEPGHEIHIKQQPKLVKLFEEIGETNQVIYTTHLPHLIPKYALSRLRILETIRDDSVVIHDDVRGLSRKGGVRDALAPVREALGVETASPLSLGRTTVIVEGENDQIILDTMNELCAATGRPHLPEEISFFNAGGASCVDTPAGWIDAGFVEGVVLLDDDRAGREAFDRLRNDGMNVPIVRTHETVGKEEHELEDLFDRDYFIRATNEGHKDLAGAPTIAKTKISRRGSICDRLDEAFRDSWATPNAGSPKFDKSRTARTIKRWTLSGDATLRPDDKTLDQFGELFGALLTAIETGTETSIAPELEAVA